MDLLVRVYVCQADLLIPIHAGQYSDSGQCYKFHGATNKYHHVGDTGYNGRPQMIRTLIRPRKNEDCEAKEALICIYIRGPICLTAWRHLDSLNVHVRLSAAEILIFLLGQQQQERD